jgi:hypothetical protein
MAGYERPAATVRVTAFSPEEEDDIYEKADNDLRGTHLSRREGLDTEIELRRLNAPIADCPTRRRRIEANERRFIEMPNPAKILRDVLTIPSMKVA